MSASSRRGRGPCSPQSSPLAYASFIVGEDYKFENGLFSGYDEAKRRYDSKSWGYGPSGGLGLVVIIVIVLLLMGRI